MTQFAQVVITDGQALMIRMAVDEVLADTERYIMEEDERKDWERLAVFIGLVAQSPSAFPVTGTYATKIKRAVRAARGPAQPQSRRNKRKDRQERRRSFNIQRRKDRREDAEEHNRIQQIHEQEAKEAAEFYAEFEARIADQPRFTVVDAFGKPLMEGIPEEMIVPYEAEAPKPEIIVPPRAF